MEAREKYVDEIVKGALAEDRAEDDLTTRILVDRDLRGKAVIIAKSSGVVSGHDAARRAFMLIDDSLEYREMVKNGETFDAGDVVAGVSGRVSSILPAERVALNLLQHLSGIATLTARFVEKVVHRGIRILDTRKTTPALRLLEKEAVVHGGGMNHRMDLSSMVLVKENHIKAAGGLEEVLRRLGDKVSEAEIEVSSLDELSFLAELPPARIMLDNFAPEEVRKAIEIVKGWGGKRPDVEVSGGVRLENVERFAIEGVDYISIGSITAAAPSVDLSLLLREVDR